MPDLKVSSSFLKIILKLRNREYSSPKELQTELVNFKNSDTFKNLDISPHDAERKEIFFKNRYEEMLKSLNTDLSIEVGMKVRLRDGMIGEVISVDATAQWGIKLKIDGSGETASVGVSDCEVIEEIMQIQVPDGVVSGNQLKIQRPDGGGMLIVTVVFSCSL